jgi:hypothetical protein
MIFRQGGTWGVRKHAKNGKKCKKWQKSQKLRKIAKNRDFQGGVKKWPFLCKKPQKSQNRDFRFGEENFFSEGVLPSNCSGKKKRKVGHTSLYPWLGHFRTEANTGISNLTRTYQNGRQPENARKWQPKKVLPEPP